MYPNRQDSVSQAARGLHRDALLSDSSFPDARSSFRRRAATKLRRPSLPQPRGSRDHIGVYTVAITLSAIVLGTVAGDAPRAAIIATAGAGALFVMRQRWAALLVAAAMGLTFLFVPAARTSVAAWALAILMMLAGIASARRVPQLLRLPSWTWGASMVVAAGCIAATVHSAPIVANVATGLAALCTAYLGAGLSRHLAMADARLLSWDEEGLVPITRDLLLGRITDGMLHNLAQPLNVISMANGNIDYIVEHLDMAPASREQLTERIERIASHTEGAADILTLFRSLGRDTAEPDAERAQTVTTVGRVLERAIAATRFTVRHHVTIGLAGSGLGRPVPGRQGTLEMLGVAALLSAFGAFADAAGRKVGGSVMMRAEFSPAHLTIRVSCVDETRRHLPCKALDAPTLWLVQQVAREAGGDFTCMPHGSRPTELVLRLARDDI